MKPRRLHNDTILSIVTTSWDTDLILAARRPSWHSRLQSAKKTADILIEAMPIYEYKCKTGHNFEVMQRMSDDPVTTCQVCEAPVERVFHPIAIHFKGSGFYSTDYGSRKRSREMKDAGEGKGKDGDSSGSSSDSSSSTTETTSSSSSSSSSGSSKSDGKGSS